MGDKRNRSHSGACEVAGCGRKYEAKGYCTMHYRRYRATGDPEGVKLVMGDPARRFAALYAVDPSGCWPWTGWTDPNGYAKFTTGKKAHLAHRWSYEQHVGPIPDGLVLDHLCRVRHCVNPEHLEPVLQKVNALRGYGVPALNARKTHCKRGHEFDAANTYIDPTSGARQCRRCKADRARLSRQRAALHQ